MSTVEVVEGVHSENSLKLIQKGELKALGDNLQKKIQDALARSFQKGSDLRIKYSFTSAVPSGLELAPGAFMRLVEFGLDVTFSDSLGKELSKIHLYDYDTPGQGGSYQKTVDDVFERFAHAIAKYAKDNFKGN